MSVVTVIMSVVDISYAVSSRAAFWELRGQPQASTSQFSGILQEVTHLAAPPQC
jgi:hypothetical protein